ncbi:MAG: cellulase family glycosylhydrolase [Planctomycetota bacterium]
MRVDGMDLVKADGERVALRAVNLGNWLLIEPWMFGIYDESLRDQATFIGILESRFGESEADRLMQLHRENFLQQRDFDGVAAAGFNAVRIPFSHIVLEREPGVIDQRGFDLLQQAFDMAEQAGIYVILDMHSAPGGQSTDAPSGDVTKNELWTDADAQRRFAWIWEQVARRFKNQPNFIAYDLLNEPYGNFNDDVRDGLIDILGNTVEVIRAIDPDRLILLPGSLQGIRFWGDPTDRGWENVGLTEHFYPGLFDGNPPTLGTHARFLAATIRDRAALASEWQVPYLWGEFNPVFDRAGAPNSVREMFDFSNDLGMHTAIWSYKIYKNEAGVGNDNWYVATNAQPLTLGDIRTAPKSQIEAFFAGQDTMPLATDLGFVVAMQSDPAPASVLPAVPEPPLVADSQDGWGPWSFDDVGDVARPGGQRVAAGASASFAPQLTLLAAGQDLFGSSDSMRLASRALSSSSMVSGTFQAFEGERFAQAGVTIRGSAAADAAHVSLVVFPDGRLVLKERGNNGNNTGQRDIAVVGFPVGLAIGRTGSNFVGRYTDADGQWRTISINETPNVGSQPVGGFFALPNRPGPLTEVTITDARLAPTSTSLAAITPTTGTSMLMNGSFELSSGSSTVAAGWSASSDGLFSRQSGWSPQRDGNALLAYRHWQVTSDQSSDVSQIVTDLTPGQAYVFSIDANRDDVAGNVLPQSIALRVETVGSSPRWLELIEFDADQIATGSDWSRLQVRFVATENRHRVRIIGNPRPSGSRDGAIKLDLATLTKDPSAAP